MSFSNSHETPLRSYIEERTTTLENTLEQTVRNRSNVDSTLLEQQIDREADAFITDVTRRLRQIRDEIKARRPTDGQHPDYNIHMEQYRQFVQSSSTGINKVTDWVNSLLGKIIETVKNIIQWINDNAQTIINIIEQIRDAFKIIKTFFTL